MLKYDVKVVKSGCFRDVILLKRPYTHRSGLSGTVLKSFEVLENIRFLILSFIITKLSKSMVRP